MVNMSRKPMAHRDAQGDPGGRIGYDPTRGSRWWFFARRRFSVVGAALCAMMLIWMAMEMLLGAILGIVVPRHGQWPGWVSVLLSDIGLYLVAMPVAVLILHRVPVLPTRRFALSPKRFVTLLVISVPIVYGGSILGSVLSDVLSAGRAVNDVAELAGSTDPVIALVFFVLLAPVFEEWLFRKQIIDRTRRYGEKPAIVLSALVFGLFHLNLFQFFYAFGLGLILGYIYVRTSRLRYGIVMHMLVNLNGGVVAPWILSHLDSGTVKDLESGSLSALSAKGSGGLALYGLYGLAMLALVVAGIVLLVVNRHAWRFYVTPEQLPRGMRVSTVLLNPGMITFVLLCIWIATWMMLVS
ncbi:MAG: type II CAAX endopeptidase family protein [Bifidobacterium sp.]|jgi:membrane protease YdiL (CAAX protease family)